MKPAPCLIVCAALGWAAQLPAQSTVPVSATTVANTPASAGTTVNPVPPAGVPPVVGLPTAPVDPTVVSLAPGTPAEARLVNLSARARVGVDGPLIAGFAIRGTAARPVLVRAAGPTLTSFGVTGALANPRLRLHTADGAVLAENSGWANSATLASAFAQAGAFPFRAGSTDSAAVLTLAPGNYTVQIVDGANGTGGVTLAEIYDLGGAALDSRLVNVSTRATVTPNGGELISGFVLAGTAPRQFLVRGIGPGLSAMGVPSTLGDPSLAVFNASGASIATNDNWSGHITTATVGGTNSSGPTTTTVTLPAASAAVAALLLNASTATGAFPLQLGSTDAALLVTLMPGAYTAQVTGNGTVSGANIASGTANSGAVTTTATVVPPAPGTALLELYELP